jgi:hypothetical protein
MCLQILTVLLASAVVRLTGSGRDLVEGLHAFRLPPLFVHALDHTLALLGGTRGRGGRRRNRAPGGGLLDLLKRVVRGDLGAFTETIRANIALAEEQSGAGLAATRGRLAHDVAVVTGIGLCMASLKELKILPGVPFAPGYKTVLLFPLYVLAARLTRSSWGATAAGSIMGVIGFLQGDGRFGVLEILKNIAPGLVIDLGEPLVRRLPPWALGYCVLGFFAAIARTATEFVVVVLLGARAEIYLFPAVKLIPNLVAGVLSGFVSAFVVRVFAAPTPATASELESGSEVVPRAAAPADKPDSDRRTADGEAQAPGTVAASSGQERVPGSGQGSGPRRGKGAQRDGKPRP